MRQRCELDGQRRDEGQHHRTVRHDRRAHAGGYFVGDYDGLTSSGATFVPFYDVASPIATTGTTDTFSNKAG